MLLDCIFCSTFILLVLLNIFYIFSFLLLVMAQWLHPWGEKQKWMREGSGHKDPSHLDVSIYLLTSFVEREHDINWGRCGIVKSIDTKKYRGNGHPISGWEVVLFDWFCCFLDGLFPVRPTAWTCVSSGLDWMTSRDPCQPPQFCRHLKSI